jgi:hypothetical protein
VGPVMSENDIQIMIDGFGVDCLYYQAHQSPDRYQGGPKLTSDAIHGYKYENPVACELIRTSINQRIIRTPEGRIFDGGASFSIPPIVMDDNGNVTRLVVYDRIFTGDVITVRNKPIRDYDVLTKGVRDQLFAFDVKSILKVVGLVAGREQDFVYGTDYTLNADSQPIQGTVQTDGTVIFDFPDPMPIVSDIEVAWVSGHGPADKTSYTVEFTSNPNYVVWDDAARTRATEHNDLPKLVMCVRRAFFNPKGNAVDTVAERQPILNGRDDTYDQNLQY